MIRYSYCASDVAYVSEIICNGKGRLNILLGKALVISEGVKVISILVRGPEK